MKQLLYEVVYLRGGTEGVRVQARNVNTGFEKALKRAREPLGNGVVRDIKSITYLKEV